jgi:hypothetical protein
MEPKRRRDDSVFKFAVAILALMLVPVAIWAIGKGVQQIHAPVNAKSLNISVAVAADSGFTDLFERCTKNEDGTWRCMVSDKSGSGYGAYRVKVRPGSSCWDAQGTDESGKRLTSEKLSSCVNHFEEGWWGVVF